jgi:hypothetical protein
MHVTQCIGFEHALRHQSVQHRCDRILKVITVWSGKVLQQQSPAHLIHPTPGVVVHHPSCSHTSIAA